MKLVFATHNPNKLAEVRACLPKNIKLLSLSDIGCHEDIPEAAPTIEENALQKACYVKQQYGYDCFADDTGLEVDALDGAPGVYSARYAGEQKDDRENVKKLLAELEGVTDRRARFNTVIALVTGDKEQLFTGLCPGHIAHDPAGSLGFGYDPVFVPEGYGMTFAQMDPGEKNAISHRGRAVQKLGNYLKGL